jgi:acyl-CoA thioester hydrolase
VPGYVHRERVRFGDLDAYCHLNNVVFLRYFETARIDYMRGLIPGHEPGRGNRRRVGFIFAECHINYRSSVELDEELEIAVRVGEVRRSSVRVDFRMTSGERMCAEGYGVLVGYDYATAKAAPLPGETRELLERELASHG